MTQKKPPCRSFIIAVIRDQRAQPSHPGTSTALSIDKLWKIVLHCYQLREFRQTLDKLLKSKEIVGVWKTGNELVTEKHTVMTTLPANLSLKDGWTYLLDNKLVSEEIWNEATEGERSKYSCPKFYVKEDGLPKWIERLIADQPSAATRAQATAERIMKELQTSRTKGS